MNKLMKIVLIVVALIVALIIGLYLYMFFSKKVEVAKFSGVYHELAQQCLGKNSYGCCMSSVRYMANGNYKLMENDACETGFTGNMYKCTSSFKWCEPIKK